jgi:glycosyltransferase involved in cell wall biosynthesis
VTATFPAVSVVLPVRNAETTIAEALNSVLAQTFTDFEMIVVEDGSIDTTASKVRDAAARDPRVHVVSGGGNGITAALNRGIAAARGHYIARQDGDDRSLPTRFERQVHCLDQRPRLCAVGTASVTIDDAGVEIGRLPTRHGAAAVRDGVRGGLVSPCHGSMMIRRECLSAVGGYRGAFRAAQDYDLWSRLLERWDIDNIDEPLYHWRLSPGSVYCAQRHTQIMFGGVARTFAVERARYGSDSYALFEEMVDDLEGFADRYHLGGLLHATWGNLLLRGLDDARAANRHLSKAVRRGRLDAETLVLWAWTALGLPWIGGKPLRVPGATARAAGATRR